MAITYSIDGGADALKFNINATSGALTFKVAPDFEKPGDANADNIYEVSVKATDAGGLASSKLVKVTVTDVSEGSPPQITSAGAVSVKENSTTVMTITATDPDDVTQPPVTAVTHGQQIVLGNVGRVGAKAAAVTGYSDTMTTVTGAQTYSASRTFNNVNFTGMVTVAGGTVVFNFCTFTTQPTSASTSSGAALNQFNSGNACGVVTCNWCDFDTGLRGSQGNFETEGFHAGQRLNTLTNQAACSFMLYRCRIQGYGNGVVVCGWQCGMCTITECYIGDCTSGGGSHMDGIEIYGSDNVTVQRCRMVGVPGGQCVLGNITNDMTNLKAFNPIILKDNMVLPKGDNAPVLIARNNNAQPAKRNVSVTGNYWGDNTNFGFTAQLAGFESPMTGLNVTSDKTYFDANQATNTPGLVYWSGNVWSPNGEGVTKHTPGAAVGAADFSNGSTAWNGKVLPSGGTEPPIEPPIEPPVEPPPSGYNDGLAGASGGTPQFPTLLNSYGGRNARVKDKIDGKQYQPPWNVAGVDYRVGIQQGKVLKPITQINMPNVKVENKMVRCSGSGYVIDGFDFTGYTFYLECQNVTIRNCRNIDCTNYTIYMVGTSEGVWHPSDITIEYCELTSKQTSLDGLWSFIRLFGGGTNTVQYCDMHHSCGHIYEVAADSGGKSMLRYNLIREIGCADPTNHVNYTQTWSSAPNAKHDYLFNTFVHHKQPAGGQMLQIDGTNGTILNNVIMAINAPDPNPPPPFQQGNDVMTYMIDVGHAGQPFTNIQVKDNFIDPSLSYAAGYKVFYQPSGQSPQTITSGNIDMRNGNTLSNTS